MRTPNRGMIFAPSSSRRPEDVTRKKPSVSIHPDMHTPIDFVLTPSATCYAGFCVKALDDVLTPSEPQSRRGSANRFSKKIYERLKPLGEEIAIIELKDSWASITGKVGRKQVQRGYWTVSIVLRRGCRKSEQHGL
ncbi:hypothetical protein E1B28_012075 [Marasmius oreades]|uniref:Uncharacterized protein n=1 Tax=Marasmius oreades TaxID=181124 RepID=A0A9P7RRR1_9AGAR|nr:uncharacterized protein E1B28_012075 [Marasmius oreades]KAG7088041.1 hypothetical protein E1B28_012075 [Marasmius oreades]